MPTNHDTYDHTGIPGTGGTPTLTSSTNQLSADVTVTSANTYYDGPSLSLAAGTWLLTAAITVADLNESCLWTAKVWDGTTVASSIQGANLSGGALSMTLSAIVSPGSTTTYKVSAASNGTNGVIRAAASTNGAGNNASSLTAVKIG